MTPARDGPLPARSATELTGNNPSVTVGMNQSGHANESKASNDPPELTTGGGLGGLPRRGRRN